MIASKPEAEIISFPKVPGRKISSTEKIWGKAVYAHGYAGIPSILIQAQRRLGINSTQMNIIIQLLDYWREPLRKPFPAKRELAKRMNVTEKTIQNNMRALEQAGYVYRRKTQDSRWRLEQQYLPSRWASSEDSGARTGFCGGKEAAKGGESRPPDPKRPPEMTNPGRMPKAETVPGCTTNKLRRVGKKCKRR